MPVLSGGGFPVRPPFTEELLSLLALQIERAELVGLHIRQRGIAGMVHYHVQQHTNTALVRAVDQRAQICLTAHVGIQRRPVQGVVAMVGIVREVAFGSAAYPAVDLLKGCADPQRVNPQPGEVVQLAG